MAKITLSDLTSLANDTSATNSINVNFQAIEDYINNYVFSRSSGDPNTILQDIDMNNYDLLNVTEMNGVDVGLLATNLSNQVTYATEWANNPEDSLVSSAAGGDQVDDYSALHHATKAAASASAASTSETNAAASEAAAVASYDAFDDRYLGQKASDPALDNDGDALLTGALYFNTASSEMKVYNGSSWEAAYLPASAYAALGSNNTWTASQAGSTQINSTATGSITLDFSSYQNFILTATGNITLANPSTETIGQSGFICLVQDATGSRTLTLDTEYLTAGAAGITISTAANSIDIIPYVVVSNGAVCLGQAQLAFGV